MIQRVHIFGASGSGTTTLGKALAGVMACQHYDTDNYYWIRTDPPFTTVRKLADRQGRLKYDLEHTDSWVLSGSLCGWGDFAMSMFDLAVFIWLPADVRMQRLQDREIERYGPAIKEPANPGYESYRAFLDWAAAYDDGGLDMRSKAMHEKWIRQLPCPLLRIEGVHSVDENLRMVLEQVLPNKTMQRTYNEDRTEG